MQNSKSRIELEQEEIKRLLGSKRTYSRPSQDQGNLKTESPKKEGLKVAEEVCEQEQ